MEKSIITLCWIVGLLMAGAEGPYVINIIGALVFFAASVLVGNIACEEIEKGSNN